MAGSDLFTGTLDMVVLGTLGDGPRHGYGIGRWIREHTEGVLEVGEGALYPSLHRLETRGLVAAEWRKTDTGRKAKFYQLTEAGRAFLAAEGQRWTDFSGAVSAILGSRA